MIWFQGVRRGISTIASISAPVSKGTELYESH